MSKAFEGLWYTKEYHAAFARVRPEVRRIAIQLAEEFGPFEGELVLHHAVMEAALYARMDARSRKDKNGSNAEKRNESQA